MYPSQEATKKAWQGMMNRCYTITNKDYANVGGKGITVYPQWHNFDMFLHDMGNKPANSRLARYCDGLNFEPNNVHWCEVTNYSKSREYSIWKGIRRRCGVTKPTVDISNKSYVDRDMYMSEDWVENFQSFLAHVGVAPSIEHTIDRIDNSKGYEPGNVRWATKKEQANNRSDNVWIEMDGDRKTLQEWCDYYGVSRVTVSSRWRMLFTPPKKKGFECAQFDMQGNLIAKYKGVKEAALKTGIKQTTIAKCLSGGNASAGGYKWEYGVG